MLTRAYKVESEIFGSAHSGGVNFPLLLVELTSKLSSKLIIINSPVKNWITKITVKNEIIIKIK